MRPPARDYNSNFRERGDRQRSFDRREREPEITEPTEVSVSTNLYSYAGQPLVLYVYTVTIRPEIKKTGVFGMFHKICEHNKFNLEKIAFDGYNTLVAAENLGDNVVLEFPLREGVAKMTFEFRNVYKSEDGITEDYLDCLDVVVRDYQRRNFSTDKKKVVKAGGSGRMPSFAPGLVLMTGVKFSLMSGGSGMDPLLNVGITFNCYYKSQTVDVTFREMFESDRSGRYGRSVEECTPYFIEKADKFYKKVKLETIHREKSRMMVCVGVVRETANQIRIEELDNITVAEYFAKTYKPLKYPDYPMLVFNTKNRATGQMMKIYSPPEVLIVPDNRVQRYLARFDGSMTAKMIRSAAVRPDVKLKMVEDKVRELSLTRNEKLASFGIAFDNNLFNCSGFSVPPPKIQYGNNLTQNVQNGSWNIQGQVALEAVKIKLLKVFVLDRSHLPLPGRNDTGQDGLDTLIGVASRYGLDLSNYEVEVVSGVQELYQAKKGDVNLVILPSPNANPNLFYAEVKKSNETYQNACVTQCIQFSNRGKLNNPSFCSNLLMKINAKLGGKNFCLEGKMFGDKTTMVVGAVVSHPSVGDIDAPSLAAVVSSTDYDFITYNSSLSPQKARQDGICNFSRIMYEHLVIHKCETGASPQRIVVFREGGLGGENSMFTDEIAALKDACSSFEKGYSPEINVVATQTRHSVRFATNPELRNLRPGTFVSDFLSQETVDFYFVSSYALQGTAKPTRYKVIHNESDLSKEALFPLVSGLTHTYQKACKAVNTVAPIRYCYLLCDRGRLYLEPGQDEKESTKVLRKVMPSLSRNLYYL